MDPTQKDPVNETEKQTVPEPEETQKKKAETASTSSEKSKEAAGDKKKKKDRSPDKQDLPDEQLQKLQDDIDDLTDKLLRTAAEFDNYRKRTEREKQASISYGCASTVEKLLPVLDTLERAAEAESSDAAYKKGVVLTLDVFKNALASMGIEEIPALGQSFDPELHCAVMREASDTAESGTVTGVMQKGYKMGDRIIRHAMVIVAE